MLLFSTYLARIGCAFLTGTLVGLERQARQRNAGLRTNVLVSVGSAAFTVLSYAITQPGYGDPSRVAAQIVSGIGFLGGGLILKEGLNVRGLNTAATIWCSAACGTLSGAGMYAESMLLAACVLLIHCLLRPLGQFITKRMAHLAVYSIHAECKKELAERARQLMLEALSFDRDIHVNSVYFREDDGNEVIVCCEAEIAADRTAILDLITTRLRAQLGVFNTGWERKAVREEY